MAKKLNGCHRQPRRFRPQLECLEDRSVPATFYVNTTLDDATDGNGKLSLREAIGTANKKPGADVIVLPAGVFNITRIGTSDDINSTGDFDILDSVTIAGAGRNRTFIDGQQDDRVFQVIGSSPGSIGVVLARMTVRNGKIDAPGGGIAVTNANLLVRDADVTGNQATGAVGNGGGIFADSAATIKLVRSTVARNVAGNFGGGIDATSATLLYSVVQRNISGGSGGGIGATVATLTNSTVSGNTASTKGGGIFAISTATLIKSTVNGNSANGDGGGIEANTATLTNCTVSGNRGSDGGGIRADKPTLTNCIVSGNTAESSGGGLAAGKATLTNCSVGGNSSATFGGGISASTATLATSTVSGNTAATGGGIHAFTATLTNSTVSDNRAFIEGGGINAESVSLNKSTVSGNTASANDGGGINASAEATLTNSTVSGNTAGDSGGGIKAETVSLINCTVDRNSSVDTGGGIRATTATLTNCTVSNNFANSAGGGIGADAATLTNCTVSGNAAASHGGGISAKTATLTNCTVVDNIAHTGGGLYQNIGTFNVKNTIVALNVVDIGGSGPDVFGAFTSAGRNLIGIRDGSTGFGTSSDLFGSAADPLDPKLGPLANNGGPTKTHALLRGSMAIDLGINDALVTLSADIDSKATTLRVSNIAPFISGMALRLGGEIVVVVALDSGTATLTVRRGVSASRTAHAAGSGLFLATDQRSVKRARDGNGDGKSIIDIGAFER